MSRQKKHAAVDVRALEHIPAVRDALRAVGLEMVIRPMGQAPARPEYPPSAPSPAPQAAPVILDTPERHEWAAQQAEVAAAVAAERSRANPPQPKPIAQMPAGQRRAVEQGFLLDAGVRSAKLAQFAKDGPGEEAVAVSATHQLETLSEAT